GSLAMEPHVLAPRLRHDRTLRHQQMERQRRERARWHEQQMTLAFDQRLDRTEQRLIELMRSAQIEHRGITKLQRAPELLHVEPGPEGYDFLIELAGTERDRLPHESFARQREDVGLVLAAQEENQRLIGTEKLLNLVRSERLRIGQRRIIGELLLEL